MKNNNREKADIVRPGPSWPWVLAFGCLFMLLFVLFRPKHNQDASTTAMRSLQHSALVAATNPVGAGTSRHSRSKSAPTAGPSAEQIVSDKVSRFAQGHQELVAAMAKKLKIAVPPDMDRFFVAVQTGRWEEATNIFASLQELRRTTGWERGTEVLWHAAAETFGVAEQAHAWPAQELLEYGNAILQSLRPGMAYVGGTDSGRFIPTLLTETGEGESHIAITQNSLADGTYLDYLRLRYGERMNTLSPEDGQNGFTTYLQDAQKRLLHDEQFPNKPKQIRPNEEVRVTENRVQVSGQVAVMMINEQLLQKLLQKNPELSFALEESTPLKTFYPGATTLGPISELHSDAAIPLTAQQAADSLEYLREITQSLASGSDASASSPSRNAYAKLILGQADLFQEHNLPNEAAQAYQMAYGLSSSQPEVVCGYANLLLDQKRYDEARQVAQAGLDHAPENKQLRDVQQRLSRETLRAIPIK